MRRKILFLFLAIACFLGIIAIFVFDGYLGIYDTVYVTSGEFEQQIGPDFWQGQSSRYMYPYSIGGKWGDPVNFRYEINNRVFSSLNATIEASVWKSNQKVIELFRQDVAIPAFGKSSMAWSLLPGQLEKAGLGIDQYTVKIMRGNVELGQGIIINFYLSEQQGVLKIPPPTRVN